MKAQRGIGAVIALATAIGAATGIVLGLFHVRSAVGAAVIGIVLGTAIARGMFSTAPQGTKKN